MTYRKTRRGTLKAIAKGMKKIVERHTHEVPTGPHTDVRKRKTNPSALAVMKGEGYVESGRTKEQKRKDKVMGMGWKNVAKRMVGLKGGGKAK